MLTPGRAEPARRTVARAEDRGGVMGGGAGPSFCPQRLVGKPPLGVRAENAYFGADWPGRKFWFPR